MRRSLLAGAAVIAVACVATHPARAQNTFTYCSQQTQQQLLAEFADNVPAGAITPAILRNLICSIPPTWTTATRPIPPQNGMLGYNQTIAGLEWFKDGAWNAIPTALNVPACTAFGSTSGTCLQGNGGTVGGSLAVTGTLTANGALNALAAITGNTTITGKYTNGVANAVMFGADPTGVADSAPAITLALAAVGGVYPNVYLPVGVYYLKSALTLQPGQQLFGDGVGSTQLLVDQLFSPASAGVIVFAWPNSVVTTASPGVHDLEVYFKQPQDQASRASFLALGSCTSATGGSGCQYPPALYSNDIGGGNSFEGRARIERVRISSAWDGIWFDGNGTGAPGGPFIRDVEIGALDKAIHIDNTYDIANISHVLVNNFGITGNNLYNNVYFDGHTIALEVGRSDGILVDDFFTIVGGIHLLSDFTTGSMTNITSDAGQNSYANPQFQVDGASYLQVSNLALPGAASCTYKQTAGQVFLSNITVGSGGSASAMCVQGGVAAVSGGTINLAAATTKGIKQTNVGTVGTYTGLLLQFGATPSTAYAIDIEDGGQANIASNSVTSGQTGTGIKIAVANANNYVAGNQFAGMTISVAGSLGGGKGIYWPNMSSLTGQAHTTACGTSPTFSGSGTYGSVHVGTASSNSCTITFPATYTSETYCQVSPRSNGITGFSWTTDGSAIVLTASGGLDGAFVDYACEGV